MVWPPAHEWTARISDLTLRSTEWSSDGSEPGASVRCGLPVAEQGVPGAAARWGKGHVGWGTTIQVAAPLARSPTSGRDTAIGLIDRSSRSLRVLVHDFAGHPFQIDLSRALARRGHTVQHVYCGSYASGKGRFDAGDDANLSVCRDPRG